MKMAMRSILLRRGLEGTIERVFQDGLLSKVMGIRRSKLKKGHYWE